MGDADGLGVGFGGEVGFGVGDAVVSGVESANTLLATALNEIKNERATINRTTVWRLFFIGSILNYS